MDARPMTRRRPRPSRTARSPVPYQPPFVSAVSRRGLPPEGGQLSVTGGAPARTVAPVSAGTPSALSGLADQIEELVDAY